MTAPTAAASPSPAVLTPDALLAHWQGHRRLTRRVIAAFPEDQLFTFSIGGMRPFGLLAAEMLGMALPIAHGVATGEWTFDHTPAPATQGELLARWDAVTPALDAAWARIPLHRFSEPDVAFGQFPATGVESVLYAIDNEVHHRGQGYVYLRALGVQPPQFGDQS